VLKPGYVNAANLHRSAGRLDSPNLASVSAVQPPLPNEPIAFADDALKSHSKITKSSPPCRHALLEGVDGANSSLVRVAGSVELIGHAPVPGCPEFLCPSPCEGLVLVHLDNLCAPDLA